MNRLAGETSPYLLQHARNPVDWYPWCREALERARREDKLILLSVGYSACHWCHVMAHESFEDEKTGALMNRLFVCIKVDREERPDLDKVYQLAHQLMTRRPGGWPLTAFLTPHRHTPLLIGTYYPQTRRHGLPSFTEVMEAVERHYRENARAASEHHDALLRALVQTEPAPASPEWNPDERPLRAAAVEIARQHDSVHGGFGGAPKFPHPTAVEFCLRESARGGGDEGLRAVAMHTLRAMAAGGFNDQLGGGFYRYTVDAAWNIPHFEKMLYDNAQLLPLYADAHRMSGDAEFAAAAHRTAQWVMEEMQDAGGGYYSSLDADSEGGEGKFYVWSAAQVKELLSADEWRAVRIRYGLGGAPNFEGKHHLYLHAPPAAVARELSADIDAAKKTLAGANKKLLAARAKRVRPALDDKILTSWNAMMIRGLARAGGVLGRGDYLDSAQRAADFLQRVLWSGGHLLATSRNGQARLNAYLDDYVLLADALVELVSRRWNADYLRWAMHLADIVLARFADAAGGGFYFTADDHEKLLHRHKPSTDDAVPSGNGIAARVFAVLARLTGEKKYGDAADSALKMLWPGLRRHPFAHCSALCALQEHLSPGKLIILRGAPPDMADWRRAVARISDPFALMLSIPADEKNLPGLLGECRPRGAVTAYVCEGFQCGAPLGELPALVKILGDG